MYIGTSLLCITGTVTCTLIDWYYSIVCLAQSNQWVSPSLSPIRQRISFYHHLPLVPPLPASLRDGEVNLTLGLIPSRCSSSLSNEKPLPTCTMYRLSSVLISVSPG